MTLEIARKATVPLFAGLLLFATLSQGQEEAARLIDGEPFDRMVLKEKKDDKKIVLKLRPIEQLKKRRPLGERDPDFRLHVRLYEKAQQQYEVVWADVDKLELFEEMVLAEAATLAAAKKFDAAYEYYQFLERRDVEFPGVAAAYQNCLFQEATYWLEQKRYDQSLVLLGEVHSRNAKFEKLEETYTQVVDQLINQHVQAGNYQSGRRMLKGVIDKYASNPLVARWQGEFTKQAGQALEEARKHLADGKMLEAYQQSTIAVSRWPKLEGAKELLLEVHGKYPLIVVGVLERGTGAPRRDAPMLWSAQRQTRLVERRLTEPTGFVERRIQYGSPIATLTPVQNGLKLEVTGGLTWSLPSGETPRAANAYDATRVLLGMSDPKAASFSPAWADLAGAVSAPSAAQVDIELAHPSPRAEALMQAPLVPWDAALDLGGPSPSLAPYRFAGRSEGQSRFVVQPEALARSPKLPREIAERTFIDGRQAIRALTAGEIVALDRIELADLPLATKQKSLVVDQYAVPTVHMLVPNLKRPLARQRAFRRAIAYGLDRPLILKEVLGDKTDMGQVVTGPFPTGFGYDDKLQDYPCDPKMSVALSDVAFEAAGLKRAATKSEDPPAVRSIVLAYPPTTAARKACLAIRRQLGFAGRAADGLGLVVELRETTPGTIPEDCDLCYVEWPAMEPMVDARRLFAAEGLAATGEWLDVAVRRMEAAPTMAALERELQEIHRLAQEEAAVIPLWQLAEHYAYRKAMTGASARPVLFYQDVEKWQCPPSIPAD